MPTKADLLAAEQALDPLPPLSETSVPTVPLPQPEARLEAQPKARLEAEATMMVTSPRPGPHES